VLSPHRNFFSTQILSCSLDIERMQSLGNLVGAEPYAEIWWKYLRRIHWCPWQPFYTDFIGKLVAMPRDSMRSVGPEWIKYLYPMVRRQICQGYAALECTSRWDA
jgi:hypothetical protein